MLLARKAISLVLLFIVFFSLFAAYIGENFQEGYESNEVTPIEGSEDVTQDFRGTRADSLNVDLLGRVPFGDVWDVWVEGNYAYVGVGNSLLILDITDKISPSIIGCCDTEDVVLAVQVSGSYAYLANFGEGLTIIDISTPSNPTLESSLDTSGYAMDLYISGSYAYIVDTFGFWIIDISDPSNPIQTDSIDIIGAAGVFVMYPHAYVASVDVGVPTGWQGLWVLDVSNPDNAIVLVHNDTIQYAIDVYVSGQYAYISNQSGGLKIFDVSDASNPIEIGYYDTSGSAYEVELIGPNAFVADGLEGFKIIDVSDPTSPFEIGAYTDNAARKVHLSGSYVYVAGVEDGFHIVDISSLINPVESGSYRAQGIPMDVFISDSKAYIAVSGDIFTESTGLWIVDITSPSDPEILGNYDTPGNARNLYVEGNYAYIADGDHGLRVISVANPNNPSEVGELITPNAADVYIVDSNAYLADWNEGLKVIDISTPSNPIEIGSYQDYGGAAVHVSGSYAYMAAGANGLRIINVTTPSNPLEVGYYDTIEIWDVHVRGNYAFVIGEDHGLTILDISDPSNPISVGNLNTFTDPRGIYVSWRYLYIADDEDGFRIVDADDPSSPIEIGYFVNSGGAIGVFTIDRYAYVCGDHGLFTFDIIDTLDTSPPKISLVTPSENSIDITLNSNIQVTFGENMDHSYTENAFSITPFVSGDFLWSGNVMIFDPDVNLTPFTTFQVVISASAKDTAGNSLDGNGNGVAQGSPTDDFSWEFTTAIPPKIESTLPESGSIDTLLDTSIILNFTKSMDKSSVENAFSYTNGSYTWDVKDGMVLWTNEFKTFTFMPDSDFDFGTEYQVTIAYTAMDTDNIFLDVDEDGIPGEPDEDNYTWSFRTIPASPQIISTSPEHGSNFILTNTTVQVTFSKSMNKGSVLSALSFTDGIIKFSSSNGVTSWSNEDKTMIFTPYIKFQNEVMYTFTIDHSARDTEDIFLDGDNDGIGGEVDEDDYSWWFITIPEPPKVTYTSPKNLAVKVPIHSWINITFSKAMDQTSVEEAFSYSYEGTNTTWDSLDGFISWSEDSRTMMFEPQSEFEFEKDYTVRIEASAKDDQGITLDGNKNKLSEGIDIDYYRWSFTITPEPPKILSVLPSENSQDVAVDADIAINFDKSMNKGATEKAFSYTYEGSSETYEIIDGTSEWSDGDRTLTFNPDIDFYEGEKYTVTIDSTAKDADGITFEGYEWSFTVKVNSAPELIGGGVNPEKGDTTDMFTFSIVYRDVDNDKPEKIKVIIDGFEWRMLESDTKVDRWDGDGKSYQYEIELDEGEHTYYFEASDEKHDVRFPQGSATKKLNVEAKGEELIFGLFEEEYAGLPTLICGPIALIVIIAIIIVVVMMMRRGRAGEMMTFEAMGEGEAAPMTFLPMPGEDLMSFTTFEEIPSLEEAQPVLIQCPECEQHLRVRTTKRPFVFPCKCGAKLILK
jgi:hypothetical protein